MESFCISIDEKETALCLQIDRGADNCQNFEQFYGNTAYFYIRDSKWTAISIKLWFMK
jgi:hypothetical protein